MLGIDSGTDHHFIYCYYPFFSLALSPMNSALLPFLLFWHQSILQNRLGWSIGICSWSSTELHGWLMIWSLHSFYAIPYTSPVLSYICKVQMQGSHWVKASPTVSNFCISKLKKVKPRFRVHLHWSKPHWIQWEVEASKHSFWISMRRDHAASFHILISKYQMLTHWSTFIYIINIYSAHLGQCALGSWPKKALKHNKIQNYINRVKTRQ